jgi:hypothetical protein
LQKALRQNWMVIEMEIADALIPSKPQPFSFDSRLVG